MDKRAQRVSLPVWIVGAVSTCIAAIALGNAVGWYGHAFPGLLVTPDGTVSSIGLPTWSGLEQGLRFPDRIESVDGVDLPSSGAELPARTWDRQVERAAADGRATIQVRAATKDGDRKLDLRISDLDAPSWWLYAGTNLLSGGLYALAAALALASSPNSPLARTFSKFAVLAALFFLTMFDSHTTRTLVPLFHATYALGPFALAGLSLRLPSDVPLLARWPWLLRVLDAMGLTLAASMVVRGDVLHESVNGFQTACTLLFGGTMIAFVAVLGVRYRAATGTRRETLRVLFQATAAPYVLVGAGFTVGILTSRISTAAFLAIPALALAPIATVVALVRHDLWGSRALVSRVLARFLVGAIACVVALGIGAAFAASLGVPFRAAFLAAAAGALSAAPLVYLAMRAVERRLFPAAERYKPTIEQLSEDLASTKDPREIAVSVERTVRRWLACDRVAFHTAGGGNGEAISDAIVEADDLTIPARFGGRALGVLAVGPKRGAALFTTDDLDLLRTIANQAALALAHAHNYMELEERRQQQAAAWQAERLALVETLAAEIAHEVRYPINFFRSVFRRDANRGPLDEEEIDIGCEEVERLERLVSGLRRVVSHRVERRVLRLTGLSGRVEMLLRDSLRGRTLRVDVPDDMALRCDPDQATQALTNLVSNAVDATGPDGSIGIQWSATARGGELVVWDDGAGFEGNAAQLFVPWFTTKPRGTGLGLAITQRIVRAHGWGIDARRVDGKTQFVVAIPPSDLIVVERKTPPDDDSLPPRAQEDERHENPDR